MLFKKKKIIQTIDIPYELKGRQGIFAAPFKKVAIDNLDSETVLVIQDDPINIADFSKIKKLHLQVKVGGVNTSYGVIIFLLFVFWDIKKDNDKFTYEVLLNPNDTKSYEQYFVLDAQKEWNVLLVSDDEVVNTYEFANIYNIVEPIKKAIKSSIEFPCINFLKAKEEYFRDYDIDELI